MDSYNKVRYDKDYYFGALISTPCKNNKDKFWVIIINYYFDSQNNLLKNKKSYY